MLRNLITSNSNLLLTSGETAAAHDIPIISNITIALLAAFLGGLLARWLKLPPIVGYLVGGVAIGPFTPGFVGDIGTIQQLAELGVIFLLFGVGLHFSLKDLWQVRKIALPGAIIQMLLTTGLVVLVTQLWGWSIPTGIVVGLAISIASTVVLLRNLMDEGLLNTTQGKIAVGWLIMEDLATVLILVLLPAFSNSTSEPLWQTAGLALLKAGIFTALMMVVGTRFLPWFLIQMAKFRSRELFIVGVVVITLSTALGAAQLFGVSLALGAFLAGVVVNQSDLSHQVEAEVLSFRETFAVIFFVSIGMLVNPLSLISQAGQVIVILGLIVAGKSLLTIIIGLLLGCSVRTALVIAIGLGQIGEFSFLLGQAGVRQGILSQEQYSLLLTGALLSITLNPFLFKLLPFFEKTVSALPLPRRLINQKKPEVVVVPEPTLHDHVVVVGYGRVGQNLVTVLTRLKVPYLLVEMDVGRVGELVAKKIPTLYGDASNSDVLTHAHLEQAKAVIVALPDDMAAASVVGTIHHLAPQVPIIARTATQEGIQHLYKLGAKEVIYPELEGSLEIMQQMLVDLGYPKDKIDQYKLAIRHDHYNFAVSSSEKAEALGRLVEDNRPTLAKTTNYG